MRNQVTSLKNQKAKQKTPSCTACLRLTSQVAHTENSVLHRLELLSVFEKIQDYGSVEKQGIMIVLMHLRS